MEYLRVKNYRKYQSHSDGRRPVWIKLHLALLRHYKFQSLTHTEQRNLLMIWLIAAETGNKIPNDPEYISREIHSKEGVNLGKLIKLGFLEVIEGLGVVDSCNKNDEVCNEIPRALKETERERDKEEDTPLPPKGCVPKVDELHRLNRLIQAWNNMAGPNALPMVRAQKVINPSIKAMRDAVKSLVDEDWRLDAAKALGVVKDCPFLLGDNDRKWRMTFEFFVRPGNVDRIVQGNFLAQIKTGIVPGKPKDDYLSIQNRTDAAHALRLKQENEEAEQAARVRTASKREPGTPVSVADLIARTLPARPSANGSGTGQSGYPE